MAGPAPAPDISVADNPCFGRVHSPHPSSSNPGQGSVCPVLLLFESLRHSSIFFPGSHVGRPLPHHLFDVPQAKNLVPLEIHPGPAHGLGSKTPRAGQEMSEPTTLGPHKGKQMAGQHVGPKWAGNHVWWVSGLTRLISRPTSCPHPANRPSRH